MDPDPGNIPGSGSVALTPWPFLVTVAKLERILKHLKYN